MGLQGLPTWITYKDYLQGSTTRITYMDYLKGLPTIVSCYVAVMWINKGSLLGILNSLPLRQTSTIPRKFPIIPQKIPAHVIIPRKFPIIPRNIPAHMIIPWKLPIIKTTKRIAAACFHIMDYKDCCCLLQHVNGLLRRKAITAQIL